MVLLFKSGYSVPLLLGEQGDVLYPAVKYLSVPSRSAANECRYSGTAAGAAAAVVYVYDVRGGIHRLFNTTSIWLSLTAAAVQGVYEVY